MCERASCVGSAEVKVSVKHGQGRVEADHRSTLQGALFAGRRQDGHGHFAPERQRQEAARPSPPPPHVGEARRHGHWGHEDRKDGADQLLGPVAGGQLGGGGLAGRGLVPAAPSVLRRDDLSRQDSRVAGVVQADARDWHTRWHLHDREDRVEAAGGGEATRERHADHG